jgi:hypothetical protein
MSQGSLLDADGDRLSVAELELYGLPVMVIDALEETFGILYVDELCELTEEQWKSIPRGVGSRLGKLGRFRLCVALRRLIEGRPVKTLLECTFSYG